MRPPRVVIALAFFFTTVFLTFLTLRSSHPPDSIATSSAGVPQPGVQSFFSSFRAPFSLFPPNAIITLTHDNTTAFLARPAAFGPILPSGGLKGQVWIGSGFGVGFGDDGLRQGVVADGAEGELGCSDVPGWVDSYAKSSTAVPEGGNAADGKPTTSAGKSKPQKRAKDENGPFGDQPDQQNDSARQTGAAKPAADDGTDDYLHHPLPESTVSKPNEKASSESKGDHADIQSIQEGAEIAGKVVLLSRGGCGFLEKVKWAQRRGAVALMVGDDTQGGPLIQMYARGDTSNVTIPSVFTSRTTAHLLSSLIGPGSFIEDIIDENGKPILKVQHADKSRKAVKKQGSHPTFTPTTAVTKATGVAKVTKIVHKKTTKTQDAAVIETERPGWLRSVFLGGSRGGSRRESSRPPSSGRLDWVLVDEWKDDDEVKTKKISTEPKKPEVEKAKAPPKKIQSSDEFVIGVQDWRDPDLVGSSTNKAPEPVEKISEANNEKEGEGVAQNAPPQPTNAGKKHLGGALQEIPDFLPPLRGGSITPGSGEYSTKGRHPEDAVAGKDAQQELPLADGPTKSLLTTVFGDDEEDIEYLLSQSSRSVHSGDGGKGASDEEEGLWVTLTPTSGASPFLDTLLVLVVSPLVTLTVVYALLLIRSRIRRRRWRAPKSVVERLPVRIYTTVLPSGPPSPRTPSPSSATVTTPLLEHSPPARPRPRSRTTTGVPEPADLLRATSNPLQVPSRPARTPEHEKGASESSEWKKHMGKQVECVVCLEEYVDGVSRVMSLPCGHEFHVDCITPWLTTRRRTCPICKGDVVRSLARGSPSSPRYEPYHDDSDDDIQAQAAQTVNTSSSAALPIGSSSNSDNDLEQGIASPTPRRPRRANQAGSWRALLASSLSSTPRNPQAPQEDRDR